MSNPTKAPVEGIYRHAHAPPDAYFEASKDLQAYIKVAKRPENIAAILEELDMDIASTFVIPKALTVDSRVLQSIKDVMGTAKSGKMSLRVRSGHARTATMRMFPLLPSSGQGNMEAVRQAMLNKIHVDGGSEYALGRIAKFYPKRKAVISAPPSRSEAEGALFRSGAYIKHHPKHVTMPFPLVSTEEIKGVKANNLSDNGFPVLGQFGDREAQPKCLALAVTVRREIVQAFRSDGGVWGWVRRQEKGRPWLVTFRGKAKGDYYSQEKVNARMLRFYNALPRQIMLNMQVATQALEALKKSIVADVRFHSCAGVALVRGGADQLVQRLDEQMQTTGVGYAHMGDDSWVAMRVHDRLIMFALDCSSFDLTQHSSTTRHVHQVVREQLAAIDAPAADLWFALARQRNVVVAGATVRTWKHAGPSGMPLQSLVNDILMDILIERAVGQTHLMARQGAVPSEAAVNGMLRRVGNEMGFTIKVEQYRNVPLQTVHSTLVDPFLFLGYYFWRTEDMPMVFPCCDFERMMAQLPYPGLKWQDRDLYDATEAMRLGSIVMSAGLPPPPLFPAYQALLDVAREKLVAAINKYGDLTNEKLRWAVQMSALGPDAEPSLSGLHRALHDTYSLWALPAPTPHPAYEGEPELFATSTLTWADQAEEEEEEDRAAAGYRVPVAVALPDAYPLVGTLGLHIRTHPPTARNDGRPGPTAEWLPDRAPAPRKPARNLQPYANRVRHVLGEEEDEGIEVDYPLYPANDEHEMREYDEEYERVTRAKFGEYDSDAESDFYGDDDVASVISEDEMHRRDGHY